LLSARESEEEFRVQCYSIVDGKPINFDGLAERVRAAQKRVEAEESGTQLPASEGFPHSSEGRRTDCLQERIRRAEERLAREQAPETIR
jgi:hypothetical protein